MSAPSQTAKRLRRSKFGNDKSYPWPKIAREILDRHNCNEECESSEEEMRLRPTPIPLSKDCDSASRRARIARARAHQHRCGRRHARGPSCHRLCETPARVGPGWCRRAPDSAIRQTTHRHTRRSISAAPTSIPAAAVRLAASRGNPAGSSGPRLDRHNPSFAWLFSRPIAMRDARRAYSFARPM